MCRTKNVPAAAAQPLAAEDIPETTATTTNAASHGGRTFITSQGSASSALARLGLSLYVYMPVIPIAAEKMITTTPDVTMLKSAPFSVWALYMVSLRPGSAMGFKVNTTINPRTPHVPRDWMPN